MVKRVGGIRRKTRSKFRKNIRAQGKISLVHFFQKIDEGSSVVLKAETAYQNGMYCSRFHGKIGKVVGKQGACYKVEIKDGGLKKVQLVHPIHLKKVN
ncbi:MAG: 50S ribosomal protein L21e [Candidatus Nanoarchaeia archaeon]|nr:50S ribosomal protein L21e [Candidatus Nanoarchaeia archaeon]